MFKRTFKLNKVVMISCLAFILIACNAEHDDNAADQPYQIPTKAIKDNPTAASYNVQLGVAYLQQGNVERAKQKLELAMKQDPGSPLVIDGMAYFWEMTGELDLAQSYYKKAMATAKQKGETHNNYGTFLCRQGRYQESVKYFLLAAQDRNYISPAQAYENAGLCAMQIPNKAVAEQYFKTALKKQADLPNSLLELAKLNFAKGDFRAAQQYMKRYSMSGNHTADSLWLSMRLARKNGDEETISRNAELLKKNYPSSKEYHAYLKDENLS